MLVEHTNNKRGVNDPIRWLINVKSDSLIINRQCISHLKVHILRREGILDPSNGSIE
jgi:hypothetical protein